MFAVKAGGVSRHVARPWYLGLEKVDAVVGVRAPIESIDAASRRAGATHSRGERRLAGFSRALLAAQLLAGPAVALDWQEAISVSSGEGSTQLVFGRHSQATFGLDRDLGELELPPLPPRDNLDVRFVDRDLGNGAFMVLTPPDPSRTDVLTVRVQPNDDNPVVFRWDSAALASHTNVARLQDIFGGNLGIDVDMHAEAEFVLSDDRMDRLQIVVQEGGSAGPIRLATWGDVKAGSD